MLAALADGIAAGDEDVARAAILRTEWLLRARATRRLERGLLAAALVSGETDGSNDLEAARHVQRIAALDLARARNKRSDEATADDLASTDRAGVAEAYARLPPVSRRRVPITILLALGIVAAGIAMVIVGVCSARGEDHRVEPLPPPVADAFQYGGRPFSDPGLEALLVGDLTDLLIAVSRARGFDERVRVRIDAVARAPAIAGRGARLAAAWADMLEVLGRVAEAPTGEALDLLAQELCARVLAVSQQFEANAIGLHLACNVRSRHGRAHVIVYTYRIEEVVFVDTDNTRRPILSLRRIDRIRRSWGALGMQSDEHGDPVVLLDKIERYTATTVMPVLVADAPYPLGDWDEGGLAATVGRALRRELIPAIGSDAATASEIGALIAERTMIVDGWRERLRDPQRPGQTAGVYLPPATLDALVGLVDAHEHARVRDIEERLDRLAARRISGSINELVAATVRRHEAQHAVDGERDAPLPDPGTLEQLLGAGPDTDSAPRRPGRAPAELSAYLSQIANDPRTPQLSLWHAARAAFDPNMSGGAESYAGAVIVEGLGRHLGVTAERPVIHGGAIDRGRLLAPATALANASGEQLRTAARELWLELFHEPLLPIHDLPHRSR